MGNLQKKLARKIAAANKDFRLVEDGDHILVGISGGKDSWVLLHMLRRMQQVAPIEFRLLAFHLDQGHPEFPTETIREHLEAHGFQHVIHRQDTYSVVLDTLEPGKTTCSLCSRFRRGIMYNQAVALGCN